MIPQRVATSLTLLAFVACGGTTPRGDDAPTPSATASVGPTVLVPPVASATTVAPPPSASVTPHRPILPTPFEAFGGPCPADVDPGQTSFMCDAEGRVAGMAVPVDHAHDVPPASAEEIFTMHTEPAPGEHQRNVKIALEGERIWVRYVTCTQCRRVLGWAFVGDLQRLTKAHRRRLQRALSIPVFDEPVTAADWRGTVTRLPQFIGAEPNPPMP